MDYKLILLLSAFRLEEKALEKALKIAVKKKVPVKDKIEVRSSGVGLKKCRGMLENYLKHHMPDLVLITGIAGAVHPELRTGDVVFPEKVCLVDISGKLSRSIEVPRYLLHGFNERLKRCTRVHKIPILAAVLRTYHTEDKDVLRNMDPDIHAVDMESYSLVDVLTKKKIPFIFFRVISDPYNMKFPKDAFIDALFRSKGKKKILIFWRHPVLSFRLIMIIPAMLKSLRVLKKCAFGFISSAVKPEAE